MGLRESLEAQYAEIVRNAPSQTQKETLDQIEEFQGAVKQNAQKLPKFDQERLSTRIQKLKEELWAGQKPARFEFKNRLSRGQPMAAAAQDVQPAPPAPQTTTTTTTQTGSTQTGSPRPAGAEQQQLVVVSHEPQTGVDLRDLKNSVVVYTQVSGPLYLENVVDSRIVVSSHQCRLKNCRNVEVWLERCPQPTIEKCEAITFFVPLSVKKMLVCDFSWLQSERASPHYLIIHPSPEEWRQMRLLDIAGARELANKPLMRHIE